MVIDFIDDNAFSELSPAKNPRPIPHLQSGHAHSESGGAAQCGLHEILKITDWDRNPKGLGSCLFTFPRLLRGSLDSSSFSCSGELLGNTCIPDLVTSQVKLPRMGRIISLASVLQPVRGKSGWNPVTLGLRNSRYFSETLNCLLRMLSWGDEFWATTWRRKAFSKSGVASGCHSLKEDRAYYPYLCFHCTPQTLPFLGSTMDLFVCIPDT